MQVQLLSQLNELLIKKEPALLDTLLQELVEFQVRAGQHHQQEHQHCFTRCSGNVGIAVGNKYGLLTLTVFSTVAGGDGCSPSS